jgi:uncharacterized protein YutE (UPF0331/DUF86 family)
MEKEKKIQIVKKMLTNDTSGSTKLTETLEFFRVYIGEHSNFYKQLQEIPKISGTDGHRIFWVNSVLKAYLNYLANDLDTGVSLQRRIQIDTVSDILEQAQDMLHDNKLHSASACVIIGAALEEFLRNWIEQENLLSPSTKKSIDSYAKILREAEMINKQDYKDITSWAGLRNSASHGHWQDVQEKAKIELMLQGVNLFMRTYSQ